MKTKDEIYDMLAFYAANTMTTSDIANALGIDEDTVRTELTNWHNWFYNEWQVDAEGPTAEQDAECDKIQSGYAERILRICQNKKTK